MKQVVVSMVMSLFVLGIPSIALAHHHEDTDHHEGTERAPEPVTMIGLGLGAAGVGVVAWVKRRSKRNP